MFIHDHRGIHKNCVISNLKLNPDMMERLTFDVTDDEGKTDTIRISNHDAFETLAELKSGKCEIAYFHFGMTDIDISRDSQGNYYIMNSPCDGIYDYYNVPASELEKLKS